MNKLQGCPPNWKVIYYSILNDPESWTGTQNRLLHKSGICLWVGNGWTYCSNYGSSTDIHIGIIGKWMIWRAYLKWKKWQLPRFMSESTKEEE